MKKILYTLILAASATSINAQLVVDSFQHQYMSWDRC